MLEPNLDRFSRPGPLEKRYRGVKVLLLPPDCEVCGQEVHPVFLQQWNGKEVCKYCIKEINEEAEQYAMDNYDHGHP